MSKDPLVVDFPRAYTAEQILTRVLAHWRLAERDLALLLERTDSPVVQTDLQQLYRVSILIRDRLDAPRHEEMKGSECFT